MDEVSQGSEFMKEPLVSVIIPAYNTQNYVAEAIESVLNQTIQNFEIIVVDDASTDDTAQVAEGIDDPRVQVIRLSQNGGAAVARNHAIDKAQGIWIAVLDSDDWYAPNRLEVLLKVAEEYDADIVADDLVYIKEPASTPWMTHLQRSGREINEPMIVDSSDYVRTDIPSKRGLHLGYSKALMKLDFLDKFNIRYENQIRLGQDFFIYLYALACGARFVLYPKPYYFYRHCVRPDSLLLKSQLSRLEQTCWGIQLFLERDVVKSDPSLVNALRYKLGFCMRLRAYYRVVEPLKDGSIRKAMSAMVHNPYFFIRFVTQIPRIINNRLFVKTAR